MPRLYGGPSYTRPARPGVAPERPFDPDDLPLACSRDDDASADEALAFPQEMDPVDGDQDWALQAASAPFGPRASSGGRNRW